MGQNKTAATSASVAGHLGTIENASLRDDCLTLVDWMSAWTGEQPTMWGPSIVGFGAYHYRHDSGREGVSCATGFAARKTGIAIYLMAEAPEQAEWLGRLGRHRMGKACLTIRRLADVDGQVLERLVKGSVQALRARHASPGG
ncbi:DUF1801 domain-containing protein [Ideonella sp.]|uniref:DUF1801 domain-containing protein n=1 Tax=Ideonella sp. TaxID=1929293 RepID=UPI0035B37358